MITYIVLFILVLLFGKALDKYKNDKLVSFLLAAILILILSLVAGIRSINLGYDASKYVRSTLFRIEYFDTYKEFMANTTVESGFSTFSYLICMISPNLNLMMFCYSLVTSIFIFLFLYNEKDKISLSKGLIIYYLTLYLVSFNIIRQSISVAMVLYSFSMVRKNKKIIPILVLLVAMTFHNSTIFAIPIYVLYFGYKFMDKKKIVWKKKIYITGVVLVLLFILGWFYEPIVLFFYNIGLISQKYVSYLTRFEDTVDLNLGNLLIRVVWLFLGYKYLCSKRIDQETKNNTFMCYVLLLIEFLISLISIKMVPLNRLGYFYYYIGIFYLLPQIHNIYKENIRGKQLLNGTIYFVLIFNFIWRTVLTNSYAVYPYASDIFTWMR